MIPSTQPLFEKFSPVFEFLNDFAPLTFNYLPTSLCPPLYHWMREDVWGKSLGLLSHFRSTLHPSLNPEWYLLKNNYDMIWSFHRHIIFPRSTTLKSISITSLGTLGSSTQTNKILPNFMYSSFQRSLTIIILRHNHIGRFWK